MTMVLSSLKNISGSHREVRLRFMLVWSRFYHGFNVAVFNDLFLFLCSVFRDSCSLTHYSLTLSYSSVCSSACSRLHPVMIPGSLQREFLAAGRFTLVYFHISLLRIREMASVSCVNLGVIVVEVIWGGKVFFWGGVGKDNSRVNVHGFYRV